MRTWLIAISSLFLRSSSDSGAMDRTSEPISKGDFTMLIVITQQQTTVRFC